MTTWIDVGHLKVAKVLHDFVMLEALPGTGVEPAPLWKGLDGLLHDLAPKNKALLAERDRLQARIDEWHKARRGQPFDIGGYTEFLREIGYLLPEGPDFSITTEDVDDEIARTAGPQLVVPITNARY